jgi:S-adenosylmethionine/arginine decarboxylase-like enzyme
MAWGKSLSIDVYNCNNKKINSSTNIKKFVEELVESIDMVAFGEPEIVYFGHGNKAGYTLLQKIVTSNITAHFSSDTNTAYFDIFSCKDYDHRIVVECVEKYFGDIGVYSHYNVIDRGIYI